MPRTLYTRLALALLALLVALGLAYGTFTLYATQAFLQELDQRFNRDLARQLLASRAGSGELLTAEDTAALFEHYMHINPAIEIYLLDEAGRIQAYAAPQAKIKRERVDLRPVRRLLAGTERYPVLGDDPRDPERRKIFSAAEIRRAGEVEQYLYVVLGGEAYDDVRTVLNQSYYLRLSTVAVAASVVFGVLTGLLVFFLLTRRLRRLDRTMAVFRGSGFRRHEPYGAPAGGGDEVDRLGATFDAMAERIIAQVDALEEKDQLRRNLVANVSHDLRTPLAALSGYLETLLLKGDELPAAERGRFLSVAFRQADRLTRLVGELFELSKLDARETLPPLEPTAVAELLADIGQALRIEAQRRGISVEFAIDEGLPLAAADVPLLHRVLENLCENGLTHTPEGGRLRLSARHGERGVWVGVGNSGPAIPDHERAHLFDRFYQAPERRGRGAGLGLAIVKRALELHGSEPRVTSRDGWTEFSFELAAAES